MGEHFTKLGTLSLLGEVQQQVADFKPGRRIRGFLRQLKKGLRVLEVGVECVKFTELVFKARFFLGQGFGFLVIAPKVLLLAEMVQFGEALCCDP